MWTCRSRGGANAAGKKQGKRRFHKMQIKENDALNEKNIESIIFIVITIIEFINITNKSISR